MEEVEFLNLHRRISTYTKNLTRLEKELLHELLENKERFTYKTFTIENIAEIFTTSTSTVHRLSKKLEYKSFVQFKDDYFEKNKLIEDNKEFSDNSYINSIMETYKLVTESPQDEIVDKMVKCKKITIYGMGMSNYLGKIFQIKLQLLGIPVEQHDDSRFMRLSSKILKRNEDLVFMLSRSGETPELLEVLVETNLKGVDVVLITESRGSTFERLCRYVVYTGHSHDSDENVDTRLNVHIAMDLIIKRFIEKYKMKG